MNKQPIKLRKRLISTLIGFSFLGIFSYGYTTTETKVIASETFPQIVSQINPNEIKVTEMGGFQGVVKSLALSPDGTILLVGTADSKISAIDLEEGETLYSKPNTINFYSQIAVSSDGKIFAMGDEENVVIYNFKDGKKIKTLKGHTKRIGDVVISPDNKTLVSVSGGDRTIRVWDVESGKLIKTLADDIGPTTNAAFTPDGKMFITGAVGTDRTIKFWDTETLELIQSSPQQPGFVNGLGVTPDGKKLVAAVKNFIKVWDLETASELVNVKGPSLDINDIAISPDSSMIATANKEGTVMLFDTATGKKLLTLDAHKGWILSLAFSPDGKFLYTGAEDKLVKIWQLTP